MGFVISKEVKWVRSDNSVVLLDIKTGRYSHLNPTASEIWCGLVAASSEAEIVDRLCSLFAVSPEAARSDLSEFLDALNKRGLIVTALDTSDGPLVP